MLLGSVGEEAFRSIRVVSQMKEAPLLRLYEDFSFRISEDNRLSWQGCRSNCTHLRLRMEGEHQKENASLALAILEQIDTQFPLSEEGIRSGLQRGYNPGRLEWIQPNLLVDCAHNPAGASRLAQYLEKMDRKGRNITLLLGASNDKDIRSVALLLAPQVNRILTTYCSHHRAMLDKDIEKLVSGIVPTYSVGSIEEAQHYIDLEKEIVVAAGSIFLVGAVKDLLGRKSQ